jgi:hypothetical protein
VKVRVAVGDVVVSVQGLDLTPRQITSLLHKAASIAVAINQTGDDEPETKTAATGFTAHLDLDPERNLQEDLSEWFED